MSKAKQTIRAQYTGRERVQFKSDKPSRTKQSFKTECDVHEILKRYTRTGILDHVRSVKGSFMDAPDIDFQTAQNMIAEAKSSFMQLPSEIRRRFNNDPGAFMDFVHDEKNFDECVELGLLEAPDDEGFNRSNDDRPVRTGGDGQGSPEPKKEEPARPDPQPKKGEEN